MDETMIETTTEETATEAEAPEVEGSRAEAEADTVESAADKSESKTKGKTIPYERFQAENKKRQDLERQVARMQGQIDAMGQRPTIQREQPELSDDEVWKQGVAKYTHGAAEKIADQKTFDKIVALSVDIAEEKYTDWNEKRIYWAEHHTVADEQALRQQANPAKFAYQWAKSRMEPPKSEEEREAEIEARIMAKLRDQGVDLPEEKPEKTKKKVPETLSGRRGAGPSNSVQSDSMNAVEMARAGLAKAHGGHARF